MKVKGIASIDQTTEEKIKGAAKKVFLEKGFGSTTTRDIAECANSNIALVNYYFRSKEKLFQEIFMDSFSETFVPVTRILNDNLPLEVKIYKFVDHMIELMKRDPLLPMFVLSEMRAEHAGVCELVKNLHEEHGDKFQQQLHFEAAKGNIRKTDFHQIELSLMAMVIFPFLSMNMIKMKKNMGTEDFYTFMDERKKSIPEMVLCFLRHKE